MKIRQRFHFNSWISIFLGISLIFVYLNYSAQLNRVSQHENHAETLIYEFLTLSVMTDSYMHHDNISKEEWEQHLEDFKMLIDDTDPFRYDILYELAYLKDTLIPCHNIEYEQAIHNECIINTHAKIKYVIDLLDANFDAIKETNHQIRQEYKYITIGYMIAMQLILVYLTLKNARKILYPLKQLQEGIKTIGNGNFDFKLPIDETGSSLTSTDELGELAVAFNQMSEELQKTIEKLQSELETNRMIEEELRDSKQLLEEVLNTSPNMIYLVDEEGRIVMANQKMADRYSISLEELIGKNDDDLCRLGYISQETADRFYADDMEVIRTQKTKFIAEEQLGAEQEDGEWLQTTLTPFNHAEKSPMVLGVSVDITDRKKIEKEILSMNATLEHRVTERTEELEKANEELRSFAYSISHDLRAPLRAIDGFSRILLDEQSDELTEQAKRYINLLRENAIMMGKLIEGLLEFSRKSHQSLQLQPVKPEALVQAVLLDMQYEYPEHSTEIIIGELPECTADPILLKQVFQNLISNAFKFSSKVEQPVIEIGSKIMDNENVYYIKDNGAGFDMQYAERLFGVFQRLHRADEFEGTGVGLAIVQRIIHRHGGEIWVQSTVNQGTTFYFTICPDMNVEKDDENGHENIDR